eukprot:92388-Prorocentrum_minimum.AAC.1
MPWLQGLCRSSDVVSRESDSDGPRTQDAIPPIGGYTFANTSNVRFYDRNRIKPYCTTPLWSTIDRHNLRARLPAVQQIAHRCFHAIGRLA